MTVNPQTIRQAPSASQLSAFTTHESEELITPLVGTSASHGHTQTSQSDEMDAQAAMGEIEGLKEELDPVQVARLAQAMGMIGSLPAFAHLPYQQAQSLANAAGPSGSDQPGDRGACGRLAERRPSAISSIAGGTTRSRVSHASSTRGRGQRLGEGSSRWVVAVRSPDDIQPHNDGGHARTFSQDAPAGAGTYALNSPRARSDVGQNRSRKESERRRWKAGKLLPLRRELSSMCRAIAKEFDLPSSVGMEIYLVSSDATDAGEIRGGGSLISKDAWSLMWRRLETDSVVDEAERTSPTSATTKQPSPALFKGGLRPLMIAQNQETSDPAGFLTPPPSQLAFPDHFGQAMQLSPSQSSLAPSQSVSREGSPAISSGRFRKHSRGDSLTSSTAGGLPIAASLEFAFDRSIATWYGPWLARRQSSANGDMSGLKEFRIGRAADEQDVAGYTALPEEQEEARATDSDEAEFAELRAARSGRARDPGAAFDYRDIGSNDILQPHTDEADLDRPADDVDDVRDVINLLRAQDKAGLASPIDFAAMQEQQDRSEQRTDSTPFPGRDGEMYGLGVGLPEQDDDKRGSIFLQQQQLERLERGESSRRKRYRDAIRLMRVVSAEIELRKAKPWRMSTYQRLSSAPDEPLAPTPNVDPTAAGAKWPAVSFNKTPELQQTATMPSNDRLTVPGQKWTPRSIPDGTAPQPLSPETMLRMEYDSLPGQSPKLSSSADAGGKPSRPVRPPTPNMEALQDTQRSPVVQLAERPSKGAILSEIELAPTSPKPRSPSLRRKSSGKAGKLFSRKGSGGSPLFEWSEKKPPASKTSASRGSSPGAPLKRETTAEVEKKVSAAMNEPLPASPSRPMEQEVLVSEFGVAHPGSAGEPSRSSSLPLSSPKTSGSIGKFFKLPFGSFGSGHRRSGSHQTESSSAAASQHKARQSQSSQADASIPMSPTSASTAAVSSSNDMSSPRSPVKSPGSVRRKPVPRADGDSPSSSPSRHQSSPPPPFALGQPPANRKTLNKQNSLAYRGGNAV